MAGSCIDEMAQAWKIVVCQSRGRSATFPRLHETITLFVPKHMMDLDGIRHVSLTRCARRDRSVGRFCLSRFCLRSIPGLSASDSGKANVMAVVMNFLVGEGCQPKLDKRKNLASSRLQ